MAWPWSVEALAKQNSPEGETLADYRYRLRQQHSVPLLSAFKAWLDELAPEVLPKSLFGEAVGYCRRQWQYPIRYVDPDLALKLADTILLLRREVCPQTTVALSLANPVSSVSREQPILAAIDDRFPLRGVFRTVLEHHANRALAHLGRKLRRCLPFCFVDVFHFLILSGAEVSGKPGAVQSAVKSLASACHLFRENASCVFHANRATIRRQAEQAVSLPSSITLTAVARPRCYKKRSPSKMR